MSGNRLPESQPPGAAGAAALPPALFRTLFEQTPLSVQVLDPSGMTLAVNRAWETLWGATFDQLHDYNILQDPQLEALGIVALLRRAFAGERAELPLVAYVPDRGDFRGTARWVRAMAAPVLDDDGRIALVVLVHEDVTEAVEARERLEHARRLLEESQRNARVGAWEWDPRTNDITWTDELYRIHGLEPGSPISTVSVMALIDPDDRAGMHETFAAAAARGEPFAFDYRVDLPDGSTRWLHGHGRSISIEGAGVHIVGSTQDVTDRVTAEAARERLLAAQRALANAGRAFAEVGYDLPGLLEEVARQASAAVGDGSTIWLLADDGRRLRPAASHHPDPAALAASRAIYASVEHSAAEGLVGRVATTGKPAIIPAIDPDELRERAHPAYRELLARFPAYGLLAAPMRAWGRTVGVLATSRSEPDRPYDEADLALLQELADRAALAIDNAALVIDARAAQHRFRGLFEGVADAILVSDSERRYLDANVAALRLLGYGHAELLRLRIDDVVAAESEWTAATFAEYRREGRWQGELDLRRKDGSLVPVEAVATVIDRPDGPVNISVLRDVTERRTGQQQQQAFLEAVSHDLKNPLASVRAQAQLLARRARRGVVPEAGALVDVMESIDAATRRMQSQLEELQDAVRLRSGHPLELRLSSTDLVELCRQAVGDIAAAAPRHELRVDAADRTLTGMWDALRLRRVLDNLLDNAVKYSPEGGPVVVTIGRDERAGKSWAVVRVADEGVGIPEGDLPHVFERYRRGSNVGTRIVGTGIGLAGVRQIVEQHGGEVSVASEEGRGSVFTVALPLAPPSSAT